MPLINKLELVPKPLKLNQVQTVMLKLIMGDNRQELEVPQLETTLMQLKHSKVQQPVARPLMPAPTMPELNRMDNKL